MPVADTAQPLTDSECETLFAPFSEAQALALAVSGGADSLALLDTIDRWSRRRGRLRVVVLIVDHRLRSGSREEAQSVARIAVSRGMAAKVLTVTGTLPTSNIEAAAREARYRLLTTAARACGATHLLTAHHRDDQAETVLMRLQRGSGVFGLAAMRPMVTSEELVVCRPFLGVPRARLAATTAAADLQPVDDPMNRDPRFLRTRLRALMPALAQAGLDAEVLAAAATRFGKAAAAIDASADAVIAAAVVVDPLATVRIDRDAFCAVPEEVRIRLLARLLMAAGGGSYQPRFRRLQALHNALIETDARHIKRTLAGVTIERRSSELLFYREAGRIGLARDPIQPGSRYRWDRRFRITLGADGPADLTVGPIGGAGRGLVGTRPRGVPAMALAVQPAVWQGDRLLAAPTLGEEVLPPCGFHVGARQTVADRLAEPPLFPLYGN